MPARVNPTIISLIIVVLIGIGAGALYLTNQSDDVQEATTTTQTTDNTQTDASTGPTTDTSSGETSVSVYTDGTYTSSGSYSTPGGTESISVTVTLTDDVISAIKASGSASGGNSAQYQRQFLSGYESLVVGKSIDEVSLSRVAGSSLTSTGFNRALDTIKNDARG